MKLPLAVKLLLILTIAGSIASAQQVSPDSVTRSTERVLRKQIYSFLQAQEEYFADHGAYGRSARTTGSIYKSSPGVSITVVHAKDVSWSAIATSEAVPGLVCAVFVGDVAPPLGMGREGETVCRSASPRKPDPLILTTRVNRREISPGDSIRIELELANASDSTQSLDFYAPCAVMLRLEHIAAGSGKVSDSFTLCAPETGTTGPLNLELTLRPRRGHRVEHVMHGVVELPLDPSPRWRLPIGRYRATALLHESSGLSLASSPVTFEVCWSREEVEQRQRNIDALRKSPRMTDSVLRAMERRGCSQQ